jgi:2-iminobutanoate/2-iminopropanoate deaminase
MKRMERIQPSGVYDPKAYAQCIRVGDILYLSGQVAVDRDGEVVGRGDVGAQAEFIWRQIGAILQAAGAGYRSIVKVTTYLRDMSAREASMSVRARFFGDHLAASTLVGVSALARPEFLIEVEVIAVLERDPPS